MEWPVIEKKKRRERRENIEKNRRRTKRKRIIGEERESGERIVHFFLINILFKSKIVYLIYLTYIKVFYLDMK